MNCSEVAQIRQQIELEMEAMRNGMTGIALGTARHAFIQARMERIGVCRNNLAGHVGEAAATQVVCKLYVQTMERDAEEMTPGTTP